MASIKGSIYGILRKPQITEKAATMGTSQQSVVVFEVHPKANKLEIKNAVEKVFDVKVDTVRTVNVLNKVRKSRPGEVRPTSWKKAYVTLKEGSSIDLIEGL